MSLILRPVDSWCPRVIYDYDFAKLFICACNDTYACNKSATQFYCAMYQLHRSAVEQACQQCTLVCKRRNYYCTPFYMKKVCFVKFILG